MADIEADVIIVGSGISGALLAAKLSNAGVKVAILEAGPKVDRGQAMQRFWDAPIRVCPNAPIHRARRPITRSATNPITGTDKSGRTNSRAPILRW
jgi:choline dehydrogenase-like flavoprotein